MAIILRFPIALLVAARLTTLGVSSAKAAWFFIDAKSQIAANLFLESMSDLLWSSII